MTLTPAELAQRRAAAGATSKRKAKAARTNGAKGGRPGNPDIKLIMAERGVSRQRAHQILNAKSPKTSRGAKPNPNRANAKNGRFRA